MERTPKVLTWTVKEGKKGSEIGPKTHLLPKRTVFIRFAAAARVAARCGTRRRVHLEECRVRASGPVREHQILGEGLRSGHDIVRQRYVQSYDWADGRSHAAHTSGKRRLAGTPTEHDTPPYCTRAYHAGLRHNSIVIANALSKHGLG